MNFLTKQIDNFNRFIRESVLPPPPEQPAYFHPTEEGQAKIAAVIKDKLDQSGAA